MGADAVDLEIFLVALAQQGDNVPRFRHVQREENGLPPVVDLHRGDLPLQPGGDVGADVLHPLRPGVIHGDNGEVGVFCRLSGHVGAAHLGPVAPCAEHHDDPVVVVLPESGEDALKAHVVVGVVDEDDVVPGVGVDLRPAPDGGFREALPDGPHGDAQRLTGRHGGEGVVDVEFPRQGEAEGLLHAVYGELAAQQAGAPDGPDVPAPGVRPLAEAEGGHGAARAGAAAHGGPAGVVEIAYRLAALGEKGGLAGAVLVIVRVLGGADVVGGEVEEQGGVELDARHPVELHGLRGHLHDHVGAARLLHLGEALVQLQRLRGGIPGVAEHLVPDEGAHGADHAGLMARGGENGAEDIGGGGLALGAGDADDGQPVGGVAIEGGGQQGQRDPAVFHLNDGGAPRAVHRVLHYYCGGPLSGHGGDEIVAVRPGAGQRHEQALRPGLPGVAAQAGDLRVRRTGQQGMGNITEQFGQRHGKDPFSCLCQSMQICPVWRAGSQKFTDFRAVTPDRPPA